MANKKTTLIKKQTNQIKKAAKKNPKVFLIILLVVAVIAGIAVGIYLWKNKDSEKPQNPNEPHHHDPIESGEVNINFLELGNDRIGDSTFMKVGDVDILIDAGSRKNSAETIENFMKTKMTDDKIEYVIATHAHEDHIAGFVGTSTYGGIFDHYKVGTLIQFARTDSTTKLYSDYCEKVEALKAAGTTVLKADECVNHPFTLADKITLEVLDQKFYHQSASTENNYSVCTMLTQGDNHYLFTGDLEKAGEESLVKLDLDEDGNHIKLTHCELFKGGHHGSETSNNDVLLSVITPDTVCICTCCGSTEYTSDAAKIFPAQVVCDRIGKYTNKIYVTASVIDGTYAPMNGNITFKCVNGVDYVISGSNNNTILKDTDWFKNNRTWNGV